MVLRVDNLDTKELDKKDLTTLHPWEYLEYRGTGGRTFIEKSKGIYLYDKDGRKLIDGPGGMWNVNIGHGVDEIADAVSNQIRTMSYASPCLLYTSPSPRDKRQSRMPSSA